MYLYIQYIKDENVQCDRHELVAKKSFVIGILKRFSKWQCMPILRQPKTMYVNGKLKSVTRKHMTV